MTPGETFRANLPLIARIVGRVCRRARIEGAEAEDFASSVNISLMDNDYAILRKHDGTSSLAGYLSVVIQRLLLDQRDRTWGRWQPSSEARRMGEVGILLERMHGRDAVALENVLPAARALDATITREKLEAMAARLPVRAARPREVDLEDAAEARLAAAQTAETDVLTAEVRNLSDTASTAVRRTLEAMPLEDRSLVRFHYSEGMSIADISRMMRLPQRPLYRRLEGLLAKLRQSLVSNGIDARAASELIGSSLQSMDFGFAAGKNAGALRSHEMDGPGPGGAL